MNPWPRGRVLNDKERTVTSKQLQGTNWVEGLKSRILTFYINRWPQGNSGSEGWRGVLSNSQRRGTPRHAHVTSSGRIPHMQASAPCRFHLTGISYLGFRMSDVYILVFDCYVCPWNLFRVVWVLSSLRSIYRNIPMTQPRTMSKPTSSFDTLLADAFPENGERETCTVGLRLPVARRLLFDCFKPDD